MPPSAPRRVLYGPVMSLLVLAGVLAGSTAHAFSVPACEALHAWSAVAEPRDTGYALTPRIGLPAYLAPGPTEAVFGLAAAQWSPDQVKAVEAGLAECQRSARNAKDRALADAFRSADAALRGLEKGHKAVEKARSAAQAHVAELGALPPSAELARAVAALAATDPGAPAPIRGLSRELAAPVGGLLRSLPDLPPADHAALVAELERLSINGWEAVAGALDAEIAAAGDGVGGLLAVQAVRLRALRDADEPRIAKRVAQAEQDVAQRRGALTRVAGQWVPPSCEALYTWSGAPDARERLPLGTQSSYRLFDDAASEPVFGRPLVDWTDDDLAAFSTLLGLCAGEWRLQLDALPARRLDDVGDDAPAVLRAARGGSWIDQADSRVAQGRERLQAHRAATVALAEAVGTAAALPVEPASLQRLAELSGLPAQQGLDAEARRAYQEAIRARRDELARALVAEVIEGADALQVKSLSDLPKLWRYGAESSRKLADREVLARLQPAWELALTRHLDRLQPEFEQRLDAMPVSLQGMAQAWESVATLTGARDAHEQKAFTAYRFAAANRVRAIHDVLEARYCTAERKRLGLDGGDGRQPLWDGAQGRALGEVACIMAAAGNPISEYDGPGLFSRGQRFKTDLSGYGYHTVELHEAEVAPGSEMLLGHRLADANGERALSVQDWLGYLARATRAPYRGDPRCAGPGLPDRAEASPAAGLLALACLLPGMPAAR
jgi:hypothetical protein